MKRIVAVGGAIILFVVGVCVGLLFQGSGSDKDTKPAQDLYSTAQKAAETQCKKSGGTQNECVNLRTTSIQDVSCLNSAPQNGGKDRCGYWVFNFTSSTTYSPFRVIDIRVRYDGSILNIQLDD